MEELLQLHVVIPEEAPDELDSDIMGGFDDVYYLLKEHFRVPNEIPTYEHLGITNSSSLFERRADNMEDVAEIERQLEEWYPNASVYRSSYDQTIGEMRTPADPDANIMFLVTNWGIEEPRIRWKREKETLQVPPLVLDDEIFHGNRDGLFAIDSASGDILWKQDVGNIVQVPVGNENLIIGNHGLELVALNRTSGEIQWRTEFDLEDDEIIDSRVALGTDEAYVGLRTGEVTAVSLDTGERRVLCECDDAVVSLQMIEPGLIATTSSRARYLVDSSGKTEWPDSSDLTPSIMHSQDGRLYASTRDSLLAMTEEDGTIEWKVDFPAVNGMVQFGDTLYVTTNSNLIGVDAETGDREWDSQVAKEFGTLSNPVGVSDVVACVSSTKTVDEEWYSFEQNILHIIDPTDGTEIQEFELGVGDCYGPAAVDDSIVCYAGGELICVENFPTTG